jgi:hypothetical protein
LGDRAGYAAVGSQVEHKGYSPTHPAKAEQAGSSSTATATCGGGYVAAKPTMPKPFNLHGSGSGAPAEHKVQDITFTLNNLVYLSSICVQ